MTVDWDSAAKVAQILFYVVIGTTAVLTYLSAKRGLLNTVNTEYQKRAMERIREVSDWLIAEFDRDSPKYWAAQQNLEEFLAPLQGEFAKRRSAILRRGAFKTGIPDYATAARLRNMLQRIRSDPFLPAAARDKVVKHLEHRANTLMGVYLDEVRTYCDELAAGQHGEDFKGDAAVVHNRIMKRLYEEGCGVSQIEDEVHRVRTELQQYLESFNPFGDKAPPIGQDGA